MVFVVTPAIGVLLIVNKNKFIYQNLKIKKLFLRIGMSCFPLNHFPGIILNSIQGIKLPQEGEHILKAKIVQISHNGSFQLGLFQIK